MDNIKKTAFIKDTNGKVIEYVGTKISNEELGIDMYDCMYRTHNDYMTMQFIDEATKNVYEHDVPYQIHDDILAKLFTDGFIQISHKDGTRTVVKRNYAGSVRKCSSWTTCDVNVLTKEQWMLDERSDVLKLEQAPNKLMLN